MVRCAADRNLFCMCRHACKICILNIIVHVGDGLSSLAPAKTHISM
jgi:hypothetical protein